MFLLILLPCSQRISRSLPPFPMPRNRYAKRRNKTANPITRLKQPGIIVPKDHASCHPRFSVFALPFWNKSFSWCSFGVLVTLLCYHSHPATHTTANTALNTSMRLLAPALSLSLSVAIGTDTNSLPPVGVAHVAVKESGS